MLPNPLTCASSQDPSVWRRLRHPGGFSVVPQAAKTMNMQSDLLRQHLIDPELCIRCNTCEETCPVGAITHDGRNYVVDAESCNACMTCIKPCPTGAIDSWRWVVKNDPYSVEQQLRWDVLPTPVGVAAADIPGDGAEISGHMVRSNATPLACENRYSRNHPAVGVVAENARLTGGGSATDIRQIILDMGEQDFPYWEGQTVGVIPPGVDENGNSHPMRLYSIASPRGGEAGKARHLALVVKRVVVESGACTIHGVCSNYLCDSKVGEKISVVGPFGGDYLMPSDDDVPLILICTGTGIAPMRAMIERRRRSAGSGRMMLFYGGRTPQETAYSMELEGLAGKWSDVLELNMAYSRQPGMPKRYVQNILLERHEPVARLLRDTRSRVYVCGLKGMEAGIFESFRAICERSGLEWNSLRGHLERESRLHIETY